jgi:hypothetical protein
MGIEEARGKLGDLAADAHEDGTITILTSHRVSVAAIVPLEMIADSPTESRGEEGE